MNNNGASPALNIRRRWASRALTGLMGVTVLVVMLSLPGVRVASATHQGININWTWNQCRAVTTSNDLDRDGLVDACEDALQSAFAPRMWFHSGESCDAWRPTYAVRQAGNQEVLIFYAFSYYRDCGSLSHDGDSEFIAVRVRYGFEPYSSTWGVVNIFYAAHYKAPVGDKSELVQWNDSRQQWVSNVRGRPVAYVGRNKHASYVNVQKCSNSGDSCNQGFIKFPNNPRNLGSSANRLIDRVDMNGFSEWYWTLSRFCGWRTNNRAFPNCSTEYSRHLTDFGF
jgi:hypothetical protein